MYHKSASGLPKNYNNNKTQQQQQQNIIKIKINKKQQPYLKTSFGTEPPHYRDLVYLRAHPDKGRQVCVLYRKQLQR